MHICALTLHNFRLYEQAHFSFSAGINTIKGPNGHGKTSLLEALYFSMTGRSFRTRQQSELIHHKASHFFLSVDFIKHDIEQQLRLYYSPKEKRLISNSTYSSSYTSLLGMIPGTVIHPDDVELIKGAPGGRRQLLDMQLSQTDPLYVHHHTRYERALRQRNHLLRAKTLMTIDSWEYEMANSAAYLVSRRAEAVCSLNKTAPGIYQKVTSSTEDLHLYYQAHGLGNSQNYEEEYLRNLFREQYRRHRQKEVDLGFTLTGPHKDDMIISLGKQEARLFGSEGQQRSCVIALRLAEWQRLREMSEVTPLMLIDDMTMSLDNKRKMALEEYLASLGQVFMTVAE